MGIGMESAIVNQLKKGQGEQNERLEKLIAQQIKTNDLLEQWLQPQPTQSVCSACGNQQEQGGYCVACGTLIA